MSTKAQRRQKRKEGLQQMAKGIGQTATSVAPIVAAAVTPGVANKAAILAGAHAAAKVASKGKRGIVTDTARGVGQGFVNTTAGLLKTLFNHPEWYENYDLNGLINLNFGRRKGAYEYSEVVSGGSLNASSVSTTAALQVQLVKPLLENKDWDQAVQYMYSNIRAANAGAINYTMYDLERYILDVRNVHAIYATMRKMYALLMNINLYDSTSPKAFFFANGYDYDSFMENAGNLRQYANKLSIQIEKLLPLKINLIDRTRWMFSNGFADSDDAKAVPYFFRLESISDFTKMDTIPAYIALSSHTPNDNATGMAYSTFISNVTAYINRVTSNDIYAIIAGDILKAFGTDAIYPSEIWGENMSLPIVYDEAALSQIQNASISAAILTYDTTSKSKFISYTSAKVVVPDDINMAAYFGGDSATLADYLRTCMINTYKNNVNPGEAISLTRLAHTCALNSGEDNDFAITTMGTEIIVNFSSYCNFNGNLYDFSWYDGTGAYTQACMKNLLTIYLGKQTEAGTAMEQIGRWAEHDWAPMLCPCYNAYPANSSVLYANKSSALWDFNNYALIDNKELEMFHGYAALSLLATPRLLKQSNAKLID